MKIKCLIWILIICCTQNIYSQTEKPIWDIGTKWTYEFRPFSYSVSYLTNEITDTVTIDNLKLYKVESSPLSSGIQYFYYENNKVYNYDTSTKILQLLYDFDQIENYTIHYQPVCDPYFNYDSLAFKEYHIFMDSIGQFQMPDGSFRSIQYVTPVDTSYREVDTIVISDRSRLIVDGVGFLLGGKLHAHDWELGMYVCDQVVNCVSELRCFEHSDGTLYNFGNIPCDSTWIISSTNNFETDSEVKIHPNPTPEYVQISNIGQNCKYDIVNMQGQKLQEGFISNDDFLELKYSGLLFVRLYFEHKIIVKKILKTE